MVFAFQNEQREASPPAFLSPPPPPVTALITYSYRTRASALCIDLSCFVWFAGFWRCTHLGLWAHS